MSSLGRSRSKKMKIGEKFPTMVMYEDQDSEMKKLKEKLKVFLNH